MTEMLPAYLNVFREVLAKEELMDKIIHFIKLVNPDTVLKKTFFILHN